MYKTQLIILCTKTSHPVVWKYNKKAIHPNGFTASKTIQLPFPPTKNLTLYLNNNQTDGSAFEIQELHYYIEHQEFECHELIQIDYPAEITILKTNLKNQGWDIKDI